MDLISSAFDEQLDGDGISYQQFKRFYPHDFYLRIRKLQYTKQYINLCQIDLKQSHFL